MSSEQLYKIVPVEGKGLGMIAAKYIKKGTRILAEKPLIVFSQAPSYDEKALRAFETSIAHKINSLTEEKRQQFFALSNAFAKLDSEDSHEQRCVNIVRTNSMAVMTEDPDSAVKRGIFPVASRINHSCDQSCEATWNQNAGRYTIHAARDLLEGDEITIFYLQCLAPFKERQDRCKFYNFTCTCDFCSLPPSDRIDHDDLIEQARYIENTLTDAQLMASNPLAFLQPILSLMNALHTAGIWESLAPKAFHDAFKVAAYHSDQARAKIFAARAHERMALLRGNDHLTTIRMRKMMKDPTKDPDFGKSQLWATTPADTPENMPPEVFAMWLWRIDRDQLRERDPKVPASGIVRGAIADLNDIDAFPPYCALPAGEGVDPSGRFFDTSANSAIYTPVKHWCFLGEILEVDTTLRADLTVRDRAGQKISVVFFTEDRGMGFHELLKPGNTVAVLYAVQHTFPDGMGQGIILRSLDAVRVGDLSSVANLVQTLTCCCLDLLHRPEGSAEAERQGPRAGDRCRRAEEVPCL